MRNKKRLFNLILMGLIVTIMTSCRKADPNDGDGGGGATSGVTLGLSLMTQDPCSNAINLSQCPGEYFECQNGFKKWPADSGTLGKCSASSIASSTGTLNTCIQSDVAQLSQALANSEIRSLLVQSAQKLGAERAELTVDLENQSANLLNGINSIIFFGADGSQIRTQELYRYTSSFSQTAATPACAGTGKIKPLSDLSYYTKIASSFE